MVLLGKDSNCAVLSMWAEITNRWNWVVFSSRSCGSRCASVVFVQRLIEWRFFNFWYQPSEALNLCTTAWLSAAKEKQDLAEAQLLWPVLARSGQSEAAVRTTTCFVDFLFLYRGSYGHLRVIVWAFFTGKSEYIITVNVVAQQCCEMFLIDFLDLLWI